MNCQNKTTYIIKSGDTLYQIAKRHQTSVEDILELNPHLHPQHLKIGEVIQVCSNVQVGSHHATNQGHGHSIYIVKRGDTLYQLAKRYNTTVNHLLELNPGVNPNNLQIGEHLNVPGTATHSSKNHGTTHHAIQQLHGQISNPSGHIVHTIEPGDTLYALSKRYNTTVDAIMALNPGIRPRYLQIGQQILIPSTSNMQSATHQYGKYTIKQGDNLYQLAKRYNTTVAELMKINPGIQPNYLQIGQVINVPAGGAIQENIYHFPQGDYGTYTIKAGDNLYQISKKYGTTVDELIAMNPGIQPLYLQIGQVINVPKEIVEPQPLPQPMQPLPMPEQPQVPMQPLPMPEQPQVPIQPMPEQPETPVQPLPTPLPFPLPTPESEESHVIYEVQPGDNLEEIADNHQTTVKDILDLNPQVHPYKLKVGIKIHIVKGTTESTQPEMFIQDTPQMMQNQMNNYMPNVYAPNMMQDNCGCNNYPNGYGYNYPNNYGYNYPMMNQAIYPEMCKRPRKCGRRY